MLGIAHTLLQEGLHDSDYLVRCCVGFPVIADYLTGRADGQAKHAEWAAAICGIPAPDITALARRMVGRRTLICVSHSLQRAEHGEQPVWIGLVLAAMLGQPGLPGGGFAYQPGRGRQCRQARPCGAAADAAARTQSGAQLRSGGADRRHAAEPGAAIDYNGQRLTYPDIRLVYWAGGNPFHHHQDINRLRRAFARPDTIVVHDSVWTASARHADFVLPATITLEREDIGAAGNDALMTAMHAIIEPYGQARDDYAIFAGLAERLGVAEAFTERRSAGDWLRVMYDRTRDAVRALGEPAPDFDAFWELGELTLPTDPDSFRALQALRAGSPLPTPSGKLELYSETIAAFGYADCPGHPAWLPPGEAASGPLHLICNQPATRLHSQLDFGAESQAGKPRGCEPVRMNPNDAAARGITEGDLVRLFNSRGACLAVAVLQPRCAPRRGANLHRRLVRSGRSGGRRSAMRSRQPERA